MTAANLDAFNLAAVEHNGLINEDVMNQIWDISRIPLELTDRIGSDGVGNHYAEWTTDKLEAPDITNATVDGADASGNDTVTGARVGNYTQMPDKVVRVSSRARNSNTIGFTDTLAYQVMRRQQALRRDVEAIMLLNQASQADDGATAPGLMGGLPSWLTTNTSRGALGADGGFSAGIVSAPTAGTIRPLTETLLRQITSSVWKQGGDPTVAMSVPDVIAGLSEYLFTSSARIATLQRNEQNLAPATAIGSVNVMLLDHGVTMELVANRLQQLYNLATAADLFVIDPSMLMQGFLQGYEVAELDKTGTADNRQMTTDVTLKVLNEEAHGVIADIDPTAPVTQA
jgi:hypothetical protein